MNQALVGFSRETIKRPLLDLGFEYPVASQVIKNEDNAIFSRSFSKFEKQPTYKVRYEQGQVPGFDESHEGKYIVEQQLVETKKESQFKWASEDSLEEVKNNFQSWQVNKVFYDIVTNFPDVVIGSLQWFHDPPKNEKGIAQPVNACSHEEYLEWKENPEDGPVFGCACYNYRVVTQFGQEENIKARSQAVSISVTISDNIWGIQATNIPENFRAYFEVDGEEIELDGSKQIVYSNTLYLERHCDSQETLNINFLGKEYNKSLEFREQESVGWEHYDEPPSEPENIVPPNGDYSDITFSQGRVVISKEGISNNELVVREESETEVESQNLETFSINNSFSLKEDDNIIPTVKVNNLPDLINLGGEKGNIVTVGEEGRPNSLAKEELLDEIEKIKNGITIRGAKESEEENSLYENINQISFDSSTGLLVEELNDGFLEISLGSHFKTITTDKGEDVIAHGEDTLSLQGGDRLIFTGDDSSNIITLDIDVSDLESSVSNLNSTVSNINTDLSNLQTNVTKLNNSLSDLSQVALTGSFDDLSNVPDFSIGSFIYLVDVSPIDSDETVNLKTYFDGIDIVESFETSTENVELKILFDGGEKYRGNYTANGQDFTIYNQLGGGRGNKVRSFEAKAKITLGQTGMLTIEGNKGKKEIPYSFIEPANITTLRFDENSYPGSQTELKKGDLIDLFIKTDKEFNEVIVPAGSSNALKETSQTVTSTTSLTISLEAKDMGNQPQDFNGFLKVKTAESSSLSDIESTSNTVTLNNQHPEIQFNSTTYPSGQSALKDSEVANLDYSISNFDSKEVIVSDFYLTNDQNGVLSLQLNFNGRNTGYDISSNNITLKATKSSNGASSESSSTINIAHNAPSLINNPSPKLRTDKNGKISNINLNFDQSINSLSINTFPEGTFQEFTGNSTDWSLKAELFNSNQHSSNPFQFSIDSTNLAGITTTYTGNYYIQGFYTEQFQIDTNNTLVLDLGINIVNPENLVISSNSPPVNFYLVDSFRDSNDSHKQFKYIAETSVEFNGDIKSFLTGNNPPGSLTVEIEELI